MTVSGMKFNDLDKQGDKDVGDVGLPGWRINAYLDSADGGLGTLSAAEVGAGAAATDTTDANGNYVLALAVDDYVICEELQPGWTQSAPAPLNARCAEAGPAESGYWEVDNIVGDNWTGRDFGNFASGAKVSGIKYDDTEEDGVDDGAATDPRLAGFKINAYADNGAGGGTADNGVLDGTEAATIADRIRPTRTGRTR